MVNFLRSFTGRMALGTLLIHAILIPLLFVVILRMVQQDYKEQFVNYARTQSHTLATLLEQIPERARIEQIVNDLTLSGEVVYADFLPETNSAAIKILPGVTPFNEDFFFDQHGDNIYFIAVPIAGKNGETRGILRLGYDEIPVVEHIQTVYRFNTYLAAAYILLSLLFICFFGHRLTKSIRQLRDASRKIANGHTEERLAVHTQVAEVSSLAEDMESMRQELLHHEQIVREHDIALSEARYGLMTEYSSDLVTQLSAAGIFNYASPASASLLGYKPEALRGMSLFELIHPEDAAAVHQAFTAMVGGSAMNNTITCRVKRRDGRHLWLETSVRALHDATPDGLQIIAISRDVTERIQALTSLNQFKHILDSTLDMLFMGEPDSLRFVYLNKGMAESMGYTREELLQMAIYQIMLQMTEAKFRELITPLLSGEKTSHNFEAVYQRKDGSTFPADVFLQLVKEERNGGVFVVIVRDITARKEAEQHIMHLASHDALTGLPNRNLLQDRIQQAITQARRNNCQGAVMFIDLDHFKTINDSLGHDVGDLLLKDVTERLVSALRIEDTVARQGGDEFIVVLPNVANDQDAGAVAQKLLLDLVAPYRIQGNELYISASIGVAIFPDDGNDAITLLKNSDTAMYHAKESGRNNYQFFAPRMNQIAAELHSLGTDLRHALQRNELQLLFQPVIDVSSGTLQKVEVLLRWQHPQQGQISPLKFIPLAEDIGLMMQIGEWVFTSACAQLKTWHEQGYAVPRLAINISAKQFRQKTLAETIVRILEKTGVAAHFLELEITENIIMENTEDAIKILHQLSSIGVEISVDDFGTGYSNMSQLKRFPIGTLKIDRSFVLDIAHNSDDPAIVAAIITLAHSLHMKVVAEGVETEAQLAFLRQQECDQYQGYLFSEPLPAAELTAMLLNTQVGMPNQNRISN